MNSIIIIIAIILIIIAYFIGKRTPTQQETINLSNQKLEKQHLEKDIEWQKQRIKELEEEYVSKKDFIAHAADAAIKAKDEAQIAFEEKEKNLALNYAKKCEIENDKYNSLCEQHEIEIQGYKIKLETLKTTYAAAIKAQQQQQTIENNPQKYKIQFDDDELHDMEYLSQIRHKLRKPVVVGKLIWSVYIQKKYNNFIAGILGTDKTVCGIYKITNQLTKESYVGQSVNIADRIRQHIRAGVGAEESSATNQLYTAMRRDGIENFSFELLDECPREELNGKEKYFIELYQTDIYGMNSQGGNNS